MFDKNDNLIGECRDFGGNELFIDLIPSSCWFKNVRTSIPRKDWNIIRKRIYKRVNYTCECCGINTDEDDSNGQLEAHERWEYDEINKIQTLKRIIALCHECHQSTHMGYASIIGKKEEAMEHLKNVGKFSDEELEKHYKNAFSEWKKRSEYNWKLDISLVTPKNKKITDFFNIK
jgi:hypothetical protein